MEHPDITKIRRTGYATNQPKYLTDDVFGNEIWEGDEIAIFEGNTILWNELPLEAKAILEMANITTQKA